MSGLKISLFVFVIIKFVVPSYYYIFRRILEVNNVNVWISLSLTIVSEVRSSAPEVRASFLTNSPDLVVLGEGRRRTVSTGFASLRTLSGTLQTQSIRRPVVIDFRRDASRQNRRRTRPRVVWSTESRLSNLPTTWSAHRELLFRTPRQRFIFADNAEAERIRWGIFPLGDDDVDWGTWEMTASSSEPVCYVIWMAPLNVTCWRLMSRVPAIADGKFPFFFSLICINAVALAMCAMMQRERAYLGIELWKRYLFAVYFEDHHLTAVESLVFAAAARKASALLGASVSVRLAASLAGFFAILLYRCVTVRQRGVSSVVFDLGDWFYLELTY